MLQQSIFSILMIRILSLFLILMPGPESFVMKYADKYKYQKMWNRSQFGLMTVNLKFVMNNKIVLMISTSMMITVLRLAPCFARYIRWHLCICTANTLSTKPLPLHPPTTPLHSPTPPLHTPYALCIFVFLYTCFCLFLSFYFIVFCCPIVFLSFILFCLFFCLFAPF